MWSVKRGIQNRGDTDMGTLDFGLLEAVQDLASCWHNPLPGFVSRFKHAAAAGVQTPPLFVRGVGGGGGRGAASGSSSRLESFEMEDSTLDMEDMTADGALAPRLLRQRQQSQQQHDEELAAARRAQEEAIEEMQ